MNLKNKNKSKSFTENALLFARTTMGGLIFFSFIIKKEEKKVFIRWLCT